MTAEILVLTGEEEQEAPRGLAHRLSELGVEISRAVRVRRTQEAFARALSHALENSDIILLSGGLEDGFAASMLCRGLGIPTRIHRDGLALLARARRKNPEKLPEEDLLRVRIPREAKGFSNPVTFSSAFVLQAGDQCILALPGEEDALESVWNRGVREYLQGFLLQNAAAAPMPGDRPAEELEAALLQAGRSGAAAVAVAAPPAPAPEKPRGWKKLLPRRGDLPGEKARKGAFWLCVLVFLSSAGYLASYYWQSHANRVQTAQLAALYAAGAPEALPEGYPGDYLKKFASLWQENPDVAGWLTVPGTQLDYPVVQADDNDYYLHRDFLRRGNKYGVPMADHRVSLKEPSDNILLYGHNMKDGQMFGELLNYRSLEFYREHPVITFDSVYQEAQYKVFAVFMTNAYEAQGPVFEYNNFIDAFGDTRAFGEFVQGVRVRSFLDIPVEVQPGDKLLTFSTCDYSFQDSRFVVVARQLRPGESPAVEVDQARENPSPVLPQAYYRGEGEAPTSPPYEEPESVSPSSSLESSSLEPSSEPSSQESESPSQEETSSQEPSAPAPLPVSSSLPESSAPPVESSSLPSSSQEESSASSQEPSSEESSGSSSQPEEEEPEEPEEDEPEGTFILNGDEMDAYEAVCRVVQAEMGSSPEEALKAQAVATYTWLYKTNKEGRPPSGITTRTPSTAVKNAVKEVWGELLCYKGKAMEVFYFSISNGSTQGAEDVWGAAIPGYEAVDSHWDENVSAHYKRTVSIEKDKVISLVDSRLGIDLEDVPVEEWFEVDSYTSGGYNGRMTVGGYQKVQSGGSLSKGAAITGRMLRENVLGLRSAAFEYEESGSKILFTTYGYGHGVGMSQYGAIEMAKEGYDYIEILEHYYVGARVE
ncbi:MAG: class B sortase [Oscillospiraceae bacterium]|nr:class B sortase [Oscillospiraceae bacterium]